MKISKTLKICEASRHIQDYLGFTGPNNSYTLGFVVAKIHAKVLWLHPGFVVNKVQFSQYCFTSLALFFI